MGPRNNGGVFGNLNEEIAFASHVFDFEQLGFVDRGAVFRINGIPSIGQSGFVVGYISRFFDAGIVIPAN